MSDTGTQNIDPNAGSGGQPGQSDPPIEQLRQQAAQGRLLAKENAFLRAGVDLTVPLNQTLFAGYQGELTVDKVQEMFSTLGVSLTKDQAIDAAAAAAAAAAGGAVDDGQQQMREAIAGAGGAPAGAAPQVPLDAREAAWDEFHNNDGSARNRSEETRQLTLIDKFVSGAAEGKQEFIFDEKAWLEERGMTGHDFRPLRAKGSPVPG